MQLMRNKERIMSDKRMEMAMVGICPQMKDVPLSACVSWWEQALFAKKNLDGKQGLIVWMNGNSMTGTCSLLLSYENGTTEEMRSSSFIARMKSLLTFIRPYRSEATDVEAYKLADVIRLLG